MMDQLLKKVITGWFIAFFGILFICIGSTAAILFIPLPGQELSLYEQGNIRGQKSLRL
jgi:hypothetical protein